MAELNIEIFSIRLPCMCMVAMLNMPGGFWMLKTEECNQGHRSVCYVESYDQNQVTIR